MKAKSLKMLVIKEVILATTFPSIQPMMRLCRVFGADL